MSKFGADSDVTIFSTDVGHVILYSAVLPNAMHYIGQTSFPI